MLPRRSEVFGEVWRWLESLLREGPVEVDSRHLLSQMKCLRSSVTALSVTLTVFHCVFLN